MLYYVLSFSIDVVYTLSYLHHTVADLLHICWFILNKLENSSLQYPTIWADYNLKNHSYSVFSITSYINKSFIQFDFITCY